MRLLLALLLALSLFPNLSFAENGVERGNQVDPDDAPLTQDMQLQRYVAVEVGHYCDLRDHSGAPTRTVVVPRILQESSDVVSLTAEVDLYDGSGLKVDSLSVVAEAAIVGAEPLEPKLESLGGSLRCANALISSSH